MTTDLADLQPAPLWHYFLALSQIPRASKQEAVAAEWVAEQGRALGLTVERDGVGNVLIRKPASPGFAHRPVVAMQAHVDMVCEQNEGTNHDFTVDPIRVRREGDLLRATGTTLGADDGIGVAAGLAVLAAKDLVHPPIELLITIDEETGLTGANELRSGWLAGKYLLNLDSEEEGHVTIGCAGGVDTEAFRVVTWEPVPAGSVALRVKVHGAKGGHSGGDIHLGRANAIKVLAQVLGAAGVPFRVASVAGGNKRNAIPREAVAVITVAAADEAALRARVAEQAAVWSATFGAFDPGVTASVEPGAAERVASEGDGKALVNLLMALPHGVEQMSPAIPGLVQTSTNLGVVRTEAGFEVNLLSRSSIEANKDALADRIDAACALAGFSTQRVGGYPGWKPEPGAWLVTVIAEAWKAQSGQEIDVMAIHAGLECGLIGEKYPGMEMASFGPDVRDAHTPEENLSISSTQRFWSLLVDVLERLAKG